MNDWNSEKKKKEKKKKIQSHLLIVGMPSSGQLETDLASLLAMSASR